MACPWWDDDDYNRVGGSSLADQKGKSHEKDKGEIHEGKMKEQKQPEKSYQQGYNTGYMKGYEQGYESGYEYGCESTIRDTKFGDGHVGTQDSGKKFEYGGSYSSDYIDVKSSENVEYHHSENVEYHHSENVEYHHSKNVVYHRSENVDYHHGYELGHNYIDDEYDYHDVAGSHYQSHDGYWNNYNDDSDY